jgi:hypothetical protein
MAVFDRVFADFAALWRTINENERVVYLFRENDNNHRSRTIRAYCSAK